MNPGMDDARVGYFLTQTNDMTETGISKLPRHDSSMEIDKKDPNAVHIRTCDSQLHGGLKTSHL